MFKKILTAIDGSDQAKHALNFAAELAEDNGAELVILTVVPQIHTYVTEDFDVNYPQLQEDVEKDYEEMLKKTVEELGRDHIDLKVTKLLEKGNPAKKIVETAGEQGVDLIIVGNRGTSGIISWMLGSTSRNVVEACTVPVLVVKDQQYCELKRK